MATYTNKKSGETIESNLSHEAALRQLAKHTPEVLDTGWIGFWLHKLAAEAADTTNKAKHGFDAINAMFQTAISNGRSRPEIRVIFADVMFRIYYPKSGSGNLCVKTATKNESTNDFGKAEFICSINKTTGKLWQPSDSRGFSYTEKVFFRMLEASPVEFLAACGKGLGWCTYCKRRLEDDRSIYHGYGSTCAKRWGLTWGKVPLGWKEQTVKNGSIALNKGLEDLIPPVFKRDWYEAVDYLLAADYHEERGDSAKGKQLRRYVINNPFAWTRVPTLNLG